MNNRAAVWILACACVLLTSISLYEFTVIERRIRDVAMLEARTSFTGDAQTYVNRSMAEFALKQGLPVERLLGVYYATVMRIGDEVCVSLKLDPPSVGNWPVYCYSAVTAELSRKWDDVE
jgi:hypothetical protein